jgi:thiosulfate reductase cytochrome b subunit
MVAICSSRWFTKAAVYLAQSLQHTFTHAWALLLLLLLLLLLNGFTDHIPTICCL